MWNPDQYRCYADERRRPFFDLLARVHAPDARTVADLGCGSGELTAVLADRWNEARVWGVDSSPQMLADAASLERPGRLGFVLADLAAWEPPAPLDLLVSNAALQWVPDHERLVPRLAGLVAPGGTLAFQMPGNFGAPSHTILAELRASPAWGPRLAGGGGRDRERQAALTRQTPGWYLEKLAGLGFAVDAWETTYLHVLQGEDAVLEWVKGTALRPTLAALDPEGQARFLSEYGARLREAYPSQSFGTLLPFRRIFVVASRASDG